MRAPLNIAAVVALTVSCAITNAQNESAPAPDLALEASASVEHLDDRWHRLIANDEFQAAGELADAWLRMIEQRGGGDTPELLIPLQRRAYAYEAQKEYPQARVFYSRAIRLAEAHLSAFAPELVGPLTGLGRVLMAEKEYEAAEEPLLRAQGITHRNLGIFSTSQDVILAHLTNAYQAQGKNMLADNQQFLVLAAYEKEFGESPELVPALHEWARWNANLGRFAKVGSSLERALTILEEAYGPNDLRLLKTLELMIEVYRYHPSRAHAREGERAMQRMIEIYESQPLVDKTDLITTQTRMGDWYMLAQSRKNASRQYIETVASAEANGIDPELIDKLYGAPKILYMDKSREEFFGRSVNEGAAKPGYIVVQFDVSKYGRTSNIRVVEDTLSNPAIARAAINRVESAIYRPRFENGQPVITRDLQNLFDVKLGGKGLVLGLSYVPEETQR